MGLISPTFYEQLLLEEIPKVQKRQSNNQYYFALLGSVHAKAATKTLVKLTHGVST